MARPLRIEYPGACYHVMNRGIRRQRVFRTESDCALFLTKLAHFSEMFRVSLRAYCLMPNHFHLYLCTREANLSRFMQSLLTAFAVVFNRRHRLSGHVFEGRFKAVLVEDEVYGDQVSRYVHLNPIRVSRLKGADVATKRKALRGYRWSSYASLIGLRACPPWLDRSAVLADWGRTPKTQRRAYAEHVEEGLLRDLPNPLDAAAAQIVLGSDSFVDRIRRRFAEVADDVNTRRECGQAAALSSWVPLARLTDMVATAYGRQPAHLLRTHSRNNEPRQALLYLASVYCRGRHPLAELAKRLGPVSVGALTRAREIMRERLAHNRALRRRMARLENELREAATTPGA